MKTNPNPWLYWLFLSLIMSVLPARAGFMDNWVTKQVSTNHTGLTYVVYGNGRYVAYGEYSDYGAVMTSVDGANWTLVTDGGGNSGSGLSYSVALGYGGGIYLAFGGFGVSAVSSDGFIWTTFPSPSITGVAYSGTRFVAIVNDPYFFPPEIGVRVSTNGLNWTPSFSASLADIAYGNGTFVALGSNFSNNSGHAYRSSGGSSWAEQPILGGSKISFANGLFIVPLAPGTNLISVNGAQWASLPTGIPSRIGKVLYVHGTFLALTGLEPCDCSYTNLAASMNGTNWFQYAKPLPRAVRSLASDGNRLVTVSGRYVDVSHSDGFVHYLDPIPSVQISNGSPAQLSLSGWVGRSYRIESIDSLTNQPLAWRSNATFVLPSDNFMWTDPTAAASPQRFYRAVQLP
jgi:hypothetical protein